MGVLCCCGLEKICILPLPFSHHTGPSLLRDSAQSEPSHTEESQSVRCMSQLQQACGSLYVRPPEGLAGTNNSSLSLHQHCIHWSVSLSKFQTQIIPCQLFRSYYNADLSPSQLSPVQVVSFSQMAHVVFISTNLFLFMCLHACSCVQVPAEPRREC